MVHDAKALRVDAKEDTLLAAYLIDPGRASYELDDLAAEYGVELLPTPAADEETTALVRRAETPRRLIGPLLERLDERGVTRPLSLGRASAHVGARGLWRRPASRSTPIAWGRSPRGSRTGSRVESQAFEAAGGEFMIGSTQQVGRVLFEQLGLRQHEGEDRLFDRREGAPLDPARARDRPDHRGVA